MAMEAEQTRAAELDRPDPVGEFPLMSALSHAESKSPACERIDMVQKCR